MNNLIKNKFIYVTTYCLLVIIFILGLLTGFVCGEIYDKNHSSLATAEKWGGYLPMEIYTVYDKDTGVYYAVTETGGICVMQTMEGETKLVDQGDGNIIHKNQG